MTMRRSNIRTTMTVPIIGLFTLFMVMLQIACSLDRVAAEAMHTSARTSQGVRRLQDTGTSAPDEVVALLSDAPTDFPTPGATVAATDSPTSTPVTPPPTPLPTAQPTLTATSSPTTPLATESPTSKPTTASPTQATQAPILPATDSPTIEATIADTAEETTAKPAAQPTRAPVSSPTNRPNPSLPAPSPPTSSPNNSENDSKNSKMDSTTIIIICAAVAGAVLVLSLAIFLKFYFAKKQKAAAPRSKRQSNEKINQKDSYRTENSPEVWIAPSDNDGDVSTLGDPIGLSTIGGLREAVDDTQSLNTASLDRMLDVNTTAGTSFRTENRQHHLQDHAFLMDPGECFDVNAPPGKLGVILEDYSDGGVPIVHDVKQNSPLVGRIMKGDRLCSVDGVDCTGKEALSVAKLLKNRENESSRILTFCRPSPC